MKKTVVLGASLKPARPSHQAVLRLQDKGYEVVAVGRQEGEIGGVRVQTGQPLISDVHTLSLYLNPQVQASFHDYILALEPGRIIFNPGTENPVLVNKAKEADIEIEIACTLVMLSLDGY